MLGVGWNTGVNGSPVLLRCCFFFAAFFGAAGDSFAIETGFCPL